MITTDFPPFLSGTQPSHQSLSILHIPIYDCKTGKIVTGENCYKSVTETMNKLEGSFLPLSIQEKCREFDLRISTFAKKDDKRIPSSKSDLRKDQSLGNKSASKLAKKEFLSTAAATPRLQHTPCFDVRLVKTKTGIPRVVRPASPLKPTPIYDYLEDFEPRPVGYEIGIINLKLILCLSVIE